MFGITDPATYTFAVLLLILLPGPNSMFCMSVAGQYGVRTARRAIAGTFLGNGLLIAASAVEAGTLLKAYPALFHGIKLAGALYLAYLGAKLLAAARLRWSAPSAAAAADGTPPQRVFQKALAVALLNPKGVLFFSSFMVQFVDTGYRYPLLTLALLGLIFQTVSLIYLNLMAPAADKIKRLAVRYRKAGALANGLAGLCFIAFALRMGLTAI